jgi:hypothetical protein
MRKLTLLQDLQSAARASDASFAKGKVYFAPLARRKQRDPEQLKSIVECPTFGSGFSAAFCAALFQTDIASAWSGWDPISHD